MEFNQLIYSLSQTGYQDTWINQRTEERTLFNDGKTDVFFILNANNQGEWVSGSRYDYLGYQNSLYTGLIHQDWSYDNQQWGNYRKYEAEFDANDLYTVMKGYK